MSLLGKAFVFMAGSAWGIYVAQNYDVPNIQKLADTYLTMAKHVEENYRKPAPSTNEVSKKD